MNETIAAIATPQAAGGISVIRISGDNAFAVADSVFRPVSGRKLCADFCRGSVYEHGSVFDQPLEAGSGEIRKLI